MHRCSHSLFSLLFAGGTNNSSFNGRSVSWQKTKRIKARVTKKRVGVKERHDAHAVSGVSGKRTKKHQRKMAHKERIDAKEIEALDKELMDAEVAPTATKKSNKKKNSSAPAQMQE